jgi:hypothetical protein
MHGMYAKSFLRWAKIYNEGLRPSFLLFVKFLEKMDSSPDALRARYNTLGLYVSFIRGQCKEALQRFGTDEGHLVMFVRDWVLNRCGRFWTFRLSERPPLWRKLAERERMLAVDAGEQVVFAGADMEQCSVPYSRRRPTRLEEDRVKINEATSPSSGPFDKALFIRDTPDIDRVLGEMAPLECREFMWCYMHGVSHLLIEEEWSSKTLGTFVTETFASCIHEARLVAGEYSDWPVREVVETKG